VPSPFSPGSDALMLGQTPDVTAVAIPQTPLG